eukprot:Skav228843  [mRNA]  locus=scaffold4680:170734:172258:+ [translate_table: standard]
MDADNGAFPNAWDNGKGQGGKGRKGQKGHREGDEKGRKGGKGHGKGQKGHGKAGKGHGENGRGKGDGNRDEESLPSERKDYLEAQLVALSNGTEPSAVPRVGDLVQVMRVMGTDPEQLQGKTGEVIGVALLPSLKTSGGAVTVRLKAENVDVSVGASDLQIVEAVEPLPEGSLTFPKTLTGLERKFVHAVSERMGLISQSFGKGEDRYITVFRAAAGSRTCGLDGEDSIAAPTGRNIEVSGVELDHESKLALLEAVTIPDGWIISADRMVICRGPLQKPKQMDHRSVVADLLGQISTLKSGSTCSLRVVTIARGEHAIAVGVLGVPCVDRNPHILVATDAAGQSVKNLDWKMWDREALLLRGRLKEWTKWPVESATERTNVEEGVTSLAEETDLQRNENG